MVGMLESVVVTLIGFVIGGIVLTLIGAFSIKYFVRRVIHEAVSDETKTKFAGWLEGVVKDGISESLKDKRIKGAIIEILEIIEERLKGNKGIVK